MNERIIEKKPTEGLIVKKNIALRQTVEGAYRRELPSAAGDRVQRVFSGDGSYAPPMELPVSIFKILQKEISAQ